MHYPANMQLDLARPKAKIRLTVAPQGAFFFAAAGCIFRSSRSQPLRRDMPIWKLEPVNPEEHHWRASKYDGHVFIRAPNVLMARDIATSAFGIFPEHFGESEIPLNPWFHFVTVTCTRVETSDFDEEGPDIILGPPEALSRAYRDP